jgi:hypothetical protein
MILKASEVWLLSTHWSYLRTFAHDALYVWEVFSPYCVVGSFLYLSSINFLKVTFSDLPATLSITLSCVVVLKYSYKFLTLLSL